jgi:hypothetical protein
MALSRHDCGILEDLFFRFGRFTFLAMQDYLVAVATLCV